jgi:excisionase family DNA binding protein
MNDLMTTAEVAAYLRLKERKIYELTRQRRIPCTRVAGKWLFPRRVIDGWIGRHTEYRGKAAAAAPPVIAGSHDPLLDWAVRQSGCDLAMLTAGSEDGLRRLADGQALAAGIHVIDGDTGAYNVPAVMAHGAMGEIVLIEWAWREQGLVVAAGNPLGLRSLADVKRRRARLACRQEGAGAQTLLRHLLKRARLAYDGLNVVPPPALNETELAAAIVDGKADCGLAIRASARRFRLDFVPLQRERFDLAFRRRDYFEPPLQALFAFARTPAFAERARELEGYDVAGTGRVIYNA